MAETRIGERAHVSAVHTDALAVCGETWRWMSAAAGASGDRVLASVLIKSTINKLGSKNCIINRNSTGRKTTKISRPYATRISIL